MPDGSSSNLRTGGQILVDCLRLHGVDTVFCVPGESYLATLDAFHDVHDKIELVVCRQEGGVTNMADAWGKMTGKPGIAFVTRGPGATNASVGIHTAHQDSTPLILFVGQIGRDMAEREAFQEVDYRRMFGEMTKWVAQIDNPARIPEMVSRAFHVATSGRPGPVVLALPEDMQTERADAENGQTYHTAQANPGAADIDRFRDMLSGAKNPLVLAGGGGWTQDACDDLAAFTEANHLPVAVAFRRQDLMDNRHRNFAGVIGLGINPKLKDRLDATDLLIVLGSQLGEIVSGGYTYFTFPKPKQTMIHICAGVDELGKVYQADLGINSGMAEFCAAARAMAPVDAPWEREAETAHSDYIAFSTPPAMPGDVNYSEIVGWLSDNLPEDAVITNGAGNYTVWVHRFFRYKHYGTQLAPQSGAMGYGVPSGVAAGVCHRDRVVVSFSGDGCFQMNGQEIGTAVQHGAKTIFIVVNNGMYGTIRMHQETHYPKRKSGTDLVNPDFAALARAYGAHGETVTKTADFEVAFERCRAFDGPALIELVIEPDAVLPTNTLSGIQKAALEG
ncbi:MAG TPA: thiamine pyrophosphate-binding protein [Rhodospirillaceae bacterium]|nr:thiamine pyrophosphate-binding protein [Rhodospirillaceae bacterium]|tara:strand:- start:42775 stop:44457 length:1683 start_codon:yes stop_codon:yes gene_type:complete